MTTTLGPRFRDALEFAALKHIDQKRKGKDVPYISHLLNVCGLVLATGGDEDRAIAALLHDVVEDQGVSVTELRRRFGPSVAGIVDECSDTDEDPKPPWKKRKIAYLRHLKKASDDAVHVSAADKLDNARDVLSDYRQHGKSFWKRFNAPEKEQLWYYHSLVSVLQRRRPGHLTDELGRVVDDLTREIRKRKRRTVTRAVVLAAAVVLVVRLAATGEHDGR